MNDNVPFYYFTIEKTTEKTHTYLVKSDVKKITIKKTHYVYLIK